MKNAALTLCLGFIFQMFSAGADAENMIVVRGNDNYPPMEMLVADQPTGFHVDIVNEVASIMGVTVQWKSLPWRRALKMAENGTADAITYVAKTPERERFFVFLDGNVLSSSTVNFFVLKEDEKKYAFDGDVRKFIGDKTILKLSGFSFGSSIDTMPSHEVNTMGQVIKMLELKRFDIAVLNRTDFIGAMKGKHEYDTLVALTPPVRYFKNYIAFSKVRDDKTLAKRFESAYLAFKKTPRHEELVKQYGIVQ